MWNVLPGVHRPWGHAWGKTQEFSPGVQEPLTACKFQELVGTGLGTKGLCLLWACYLSRHTKRHDE